MCHESQTPQLFAAQLKVKACLIYVGRKMHSIDQRIATPIAAHVLPRARSNTNEHQQPKCTLLHPPDVRVD